MKGHPGNPGLKGRLVNKSVEAYILALETINRLSCQYRIETFCYLICNAWELLLKAKIIDDGGTQQAVYYKCRPGEAKRSLSLRDCINKVIPNQQDPERLNIELIAQLRDETVHLVFSQVPREVLCLFQASVLNYHNRLNEWFGLSLSDRVPVGMMSIVYDLTPEQCDLSNKRLRRELGKDSVAFLTGYCSQLKDEFERLECSAQFSININYGLVLTDRQDDADIKLSKGPTGSTEAQIIKVAKDPSKSHPYRQKEVVEKLILALDGISLNSFDIQCVIKAYGVQQKPDFFYKGAVKGSPSQYSQTFIDWIIRQYRKDSCFFQKARAKVKAKTTPNSPRQTQSSW